MKTAIFLGGKTGDIIDALPIAKRIADNFGKPDWIVCAKFASVFSGVSYLKPVKVHWYLQDFVPKAQAQFGKSYDRIFMAQTFGKSWTGRRDLPHNLVAWLNCGMTEAQFYDIKGFPLLFDKRDRSREDFLYRRSVKSSKPLLLMATACARSSSFASHHVFGEAIRRRWNERFNIVDMCLLKAGRIFDLLGILERAALFPAHGAYAGARAQHASWNRMG